MGISRNYWYKGHCCTCAKNLNAYNKIFWDAYMHYENGTRSVLVATSRNSLKDLHDKVKLYIDIAIKDKRLKGFSLKEGINE